MKVTSADVPKSFRALIAATLLVVMLLNMSLLLPVTPVFAESEPEGQTCSACSRCQPIETDSTVLVEELEGTEKYRAIAQALSSNLVKDFMQQLIKMGYAPKVNQAAAVKFTTEDGSAVSVGIPFYGHDQNDIEAMVAGISIVNDDGSSDVRGAMMIVNDEIIAIKDPGWLECMIGSIICGAAIGAVIGCAIATMGVGFLACLATVFGVNLLGVIEALTMGAGVIYFCVVFCCCVGYQPCCDAI